MPSWENQGRGGLCESKEDYLKEGSIKVSEKKREREPRAKKKNSSVVKKVVAEEKGGKRRPLRRDHLFVLEGGRERKEGNAC